MPIILHGQESCVKAFSIDTTQCYKCKTVQLTYYIIVIHWGELKMSWSNRCKHIGHGLKIWNVKHEPLKNSPDTQSNQQGPQKNHSLSQVIGSVSLFIVILTVMVGCTSHAVNITMNTSSLTHYLILSTWLFCLVLVTIFLRAPIEVTNI